MRRLFLSFQMEDRNQVNGVRLMNSNKAMDLDFYDESVRVAYKSTNADYIRRKIREKISRCSATVCFLGETTYQSAWVNWELHTTLSMQKEVLLMGLPNGPERLHLPPVVSGWTWYFWDPNHLARFAE
ncbi:MAG: TIR domain-containing protein [Pseudomonadota bacterium]|nr:TIR domain-containing protein [Pseudomonadota bacterium]